MKALVIIRTNPIIRAYQEAVKRGDPYADPESWLNNLSAMESGSEVWRHAPEDVAEAEEWFKGGNK